MVDRVVLAVVPAACETHSTRIGADGRVVGFVNVVFDEPGRSGEIYMIAVDPRIQRRCVGSLLTEKALDEMRA